ncbi:hypothetical protein I0C86_40745 [Plantactinospora sp. S1510]|uniref:Uncharacterized protein n=1 Tax=Plantactinospora alkalitolerans TaxID=2789879 RepID=A0ABS0H9V8_9ACTN|nr:hypothetical protein [Plantactinospora alkalitolerans]MBF9135210.1 hypothetical protein [Plantactinospora alkalitolerans]
MSDLRLPAKSIFSPQRGEVVVGHFSGGRDVTWRLWEDGEAYCGIVVGDGADGAALLRHLAEASARTIAVRLIDPRGVLDGIDGVDVWTAEGAAAIALALDATRTVMGQTARAIAHRHPSEMLIPDTAAHQVLLVDRPDLLAPAAQEQVNMIARLSRKTGVTVVAHCRPSVGTSCEHMLRALADAHDNVMYLRKSPDSGLLGYLTADMVPFTPNFGPQN